MDANLHSKIEQEHAVTSYQCSSVLVCKQMWTDVKGSRCLCRCLYANSHMFEYDKIYFIILRENLYLLEAAYKSVYTHSVHSCHFFANSTSLSLFVLQGYHLNEEFIFLEITNTHTHIYSTYKINDRHLPSTLLCRLSALYFFISSPLESECFENGYTSTYCQRNPGAHSLFQALEPFQTGTTKSRVSPSFLYWSSQICCIF